MPNRYSIVAMKPLGTEEVVAALKPGEAVLLVREAANPHDPNAIAVYIGGRRVGYVPKNQNAMLAGFMDREGDCQELTLAMDGSIVDATNTAEGQGTPTLRGSFVRSPNSGYPQVEV